jgi:hypothetical protein
MVGDVFAAQAHLLDALAVRERAHAFRGEPAPAAQLAELFSHGDFRRDGTRIT